MSRLRPTLLGLALAAAIAGPQSLMAQGGAITGKVTDSTSGAAVPSARVVAQSATDRAVAATTTREDGTYRLGNLAPGSYTVVVSRIGFAQQRRPNVTVTAGGTATADFVMPAIVAELNPVVTTASRKEEKALDAPASVAVIDVRDIQERTATTVADHVQGLAGVDVNKNGLASNNIVARGFNNAFSGSILTLQDYRFAAVPSLRVNAPFLFTAVNEDIERMEVLLGPASALYGPNSSHGVLHIITKSPFTSQGTTLTVDGGTQTLFRGAIRHAGLIGEKVGYKLSGEYFTAKEFEYQDPAEPDVFPSSAPAGRAGQPNERDFDASRFAGEARVDIRPNENSEYVSTVGFTRVGSELEYTGANGTAQVKGWRYLSLQQRARVGRFFGQVFANFSDAGNEDGNDLGGTYLLRSGQPIVDQSRLYAAQLQHGFGLWGGRQDFVYGLDYIKTEPRTGNTINGRNEDIDEVQEVGGYIQSTTQLTPMWDFLAALRLDNNDQIEGNQFSPRAALIFKPNPSNNFRVTFNRAFSTPANFSFFLDLIQAANVGGTGFNVRALGNPPKRGWQFNRSCPATIAAGLCMMTPGTGTQWVPVVAAPAYGAVVNALSPRISTGLVQTFTAAPFNLPSAVATQLANALVATMKQLNPSPAQVGTELRYLGSPAVVDPAALADIGPLKASFNNTWEFGYKGIIADKLRLAIDVWTERRGDVGNPAGIATPSAFMDAASLQAFLTGPFTQVFQGVGQPPQQAAASAAAVAAAIAGNLSQAPVGIVQFNDPKFASGTDIYATYTSYNKEVTVNGADLAVDYVASNNLTLAATYSWVSDLVFENVTSSNGLALMLNAPDNKASLSVRWRDDAKGWGFDVRGRYFNGYPVNSGVYATNFDFPLSGQAGTFQYEPIKSSTLLDLGLHWRLPVRGAQELLWSINADNILNHPYRTMPGTPRLGRMVVSRLQYVF